LTRARSVLPHGFPPPKGFANGILLGGTLAIGGQIGWDASGKLVSREFVPQFEQALANVVAVVRAGGFTPADVVQMHVYVTDKHEYAAARRELGEVWRRHMGRHYPAMTLVQVAGLLEDGAKVEIDGLAATQP
jgi:enamine deaminase RidA (YjgF/YER057c/UK114 family)